MISYIPFLYLCHGGDAISGTKESTTSWVCSNRTVIDSGITSVWSVMKRRMVSEDMEVLNSISSLCLVTSSSVVLFRALEDDGLGSS